MGCDLKESKNILILSFHFAPDAMVGAKRFSFLSKILQKNYSEMHVLTVKEKYITVKDHTLFSGGKIHRVAMCPLFPIEKNNIIAKTFNRLWGSGYLCLIDPYSGWILPGLIKGLKIIKDKRINTVIATGPPFSTMVLGLLLKLTSNVSLILDYRDPWTNIDLKFYRNTFVKIINDFLEKITIRHASAIVFCTQMMKDNFIKDFGKFPKAATHVVTNGFYSAKNCQPLSLEENKKNMVYAGAFYGERKISLLAEPLFELLKKGMISKNNFCFHIFGKLKDFDREVIKKYDLQEIIKEYPLVPHKQLIQLLKSADILVLIISNKMKYSVSYKFYDYLSTGKPILAIVPEDSAMEQMMHEIDCGRCAYINDKESIFKHLKIMLVENKEYTYLKARRYNWEEIGKKYAEIIRNL